MGAPKSLDGAQQQAVVEAAMQRNYGRTQPAPDPD
jgi:hypothetical protein